MRINLALVAVLLTLLITSCEAVGAIFKTGVWVGVLGVVFIIGIILYFVNKGRK